MRLLIAAGGVVVLSAAVWHFVESAKATEPVKAAVWHVSRGYVVSGGAGREVAGERIAEKTAAEDAAVSLSLHCGDGAPKVYVRSRKEFAVTPARPDRLDVSFSVDGRPMKAAARQEGSTATYIYVDGLTAREVGAARTVAVGYRYYEDPDGTRRMATFDIAGLSSAVAAFASPGCLSAIASR